MTQDINSLATHAHLAEIEVPKTIVLGDDACEFLIHLPAEAFRGNFI